MVVELRQMERIAGAVRDAVRDYACDVCEIVGDRLAGLTIYGSAVSGEFDHLRDVVRSVLVLDAVELARLRDLARRGRRFGKRRIAAPIIMTPEYLRDSLDTFPLELIEIQDHHATLAGEEHFDDLAFQPEHVRLECERELKTLLIGLRQGLLAAGGKEKLLGELGAGAADTLARILRGLVWLKGQKEPPSRQDLLAKTEDLVGRALPGMRAAIERRGDRGWDPFVRLYEDLEALRRKADAWQTG